ncbi:hypothetical protein EDB60_110145 [Vibrio crassostreae]|uniref:hypothetical protein n=1 Tax=Vibrio crassostreae TaxID=246167 RepID=UPI001046BAE5|nr:hypothetical protein [Vibrio crassostreae]TCN66954.1 hypothetical protein EDB60_110145 [Vibrio crassostreae]TCW20188.1 hypothetical protein EDB48_104134 [Vibrio crassostreae]CAK3845762.1 hypothetical protein VCRA217O17_20319 [Vibrio crassostreae]
MKFLLIYRTLVLSFVLLIQIKNFALADELIKTEAKAFILENQLSDGVYPFKNGQIVIVTAKCDNQFADLMFMRKVIELRYTNVGVAGGDLSKKAVIDFIPLSRTQRVTKQALKCTISSYLSNESLNLNYSEQQVLQLRSGYFTEVILSKSLSYTKKSIFFSKNNLNDLANIFSMMNDETVINDDPNIDVSWINGHSDQQARLKNSYLQLKLNKENFDIGETSVVEFSHNEAKKYFNQGNADCFVQWATITLSRNHSDLDIWKKLSSVLRSQNKNHASKISLYYSMAYGKVTGYDVMSLALLNFNMGNIESARSLAEISKQLEPNNKWVIDNYEKIKH